MPVRVSIVLTDFFAIDVAGSNFGNGTLSKMGRIAWPWRMAMIKSMALDCKGATTPRLHDHRKARSADQSRAVPQLRRLDFS